MEVISVKLRYQISLKPFELESKTNMGDINSSSSNDEKKGIDNKATQIGKSIWCE